MSYGELRHKLAVETDGMSGASIAGVCRAAASHALERAVCDFTGSLTGPGNSYEAEEGRSIADCLVTQSDFEMAVEDVFQNSKEGDYEEDDDESATEYPIGEEESSLDND